MSQEKSPARRTHEIVAREEEIVWAEFYPRVHRDATLAAEILAELEIDDPLRRRHRGLYLCCQRSIRLHQSRDARNRRIGSAVRAFSRALFIAFPRAVIRLLGGGRDVVVACLPEDDELPAGAQPKRSPSIGATAHAQKPSAKPVRKTAAAKADPSGLPSAPAALGTSQEPAEQQVRRLMQGDASAHADPGSMTRARKAAERSAALAEAPAPSATGTAPRVQQSAGG